MLKIQHKPECLIEQLGQNIEKRKGRALQDPMMSQVWLVELHGKCTVEKLQSQLDIQHLSPWWSNNLERKGN